MQRNAAAAAAAAAIQPAAYMRTQAVHGSGTAPWAPRRCCCRRRTSTRQQPCRPGRWSAAAPTAQTNKMRGFGHTAAALLQVASVTVASAAAATSMARAGSCKRVNTRCTRSLRCTMGIDAGTAQLCHATPGTCSGCPLAAQQQQVAHNQQPYCHSSRTVVANSTTSIT